MSAIATAIEWEAMQAQFHDQGYFILERVIPEEHLVMLRAECDRYVAEADAQMEDQGTESRGITHRGKRYFIGQKSRENARLRTFLFSDLMAEICRATLGEDAYLFVEQFVVKAAEKGTKFGWHQDSGYLEVPHRPYLTCWCPLDDVSEANGTVSVLSYDRAGVRERVDHVRESGSNDKIGYYGDDPGELVIVPAGSIAVFASVVFHRSGPNTTDRMRRVYVCQYSPEPIYRENGEVWGQAVPFLHGGRRVG